MKTGHISNALRTLRLIFLLDRLRFFLQRGKNRKINREFRKENPGVPLPPDYLIYESFQLNYPKYYTESKETARWLAAHLGKHIELREKKILDWGCGPGRIIRHLPGIIGAGCTFYGTDYNPKSIDWCQKNLPGIVFNRNTLQASLPYSDHFFDVIYGISIFTHLSEQMHFDWYAELHRVLRPDGILFLTTQGDNFKVKLTEPELQKFLNGELVVRGNVQEGHRTYSAFQPKAFMEKLFQNAVILEHIEIPPAKGKGLPQDVWILKKRGR